MNSYNLQTPPITKTSPKALTGRTKSTDPFFSLFTKDVDEFKSSKNQHNKKSTYFKDKLLISLNYKENI